MKQKFKKGDLLKCIHSASPGYKVDKTYTVEDDTKGRLWIRGDDGFYDYLDMLCSQFKKVEETAAERAIRTWKKTGQKEKEPAQPSTPTSKIPTK